MDGAPYIVPANRTESAPDVRSLPDLETLQKAVQPSSRPARQELPQALLPHLLTLLSKAQALIVFASNPQNASRIDTVSPDR